MRRRWALVLGLIAAVAMTSLGGAACSDPEPAVGPFGDDGGRKRDTGDSDDATPKPEEDPPLPDGGKPPGRVYAHTADTLYLFEPLSKKLTKVGTLGCLSAGDRLLDIALDRDGVMYGTSDDGFLRIDAIDATCTYVKEDPLAAYPNSLAFVPIGTVDATKEALVGYQFDPDTNQATVYVRIDLATGAITTVGDLNPPSATTRYTSSGDLISLIRSGNRAYLTVRTIDPDAGAGNDYLAEVDPANGRIKRIVGDTKYSNLSGLGQWAGTAYGFDDSGNVLAIDMANGSAKVVTTLSEGGNPVSWFGAGVTTDSPTKP